MAKRLSIQSMEESVAYLQLATVSLILDLSLYKIRTCSVGSSTASVGLSPFAEFLRLATEGTLVTTSYQPNLSAKRKYISHIFPSSVRDCYIGKWCVLVPKSGSSALTNGQP